MSSPSPTMVIFGGVNGSGKSTLAAQLMQLRSLSDVKFLDPDTAALHALSVHPVVTTTAANLAGLRAVSRQIALHMTEGRSFASETVLANATYRRLCLAAHERGWIVRLFYIGVPTVEDAIARVALRVAKGGHTVPEQDIRRRWPRSHSNLAWFAHHADAVDGFANLWDAPPFLVARRAVAISRSWTPTRFQQSIKRCSR